MDSPRQSPRGISGFARNSVKFVRNVWCREGESNPQGRSPADFEGIEMNCAPMLPITSERVRRGFNEYVTAVNCPPHTPIAPGSGHTGVTKRVALNVCLDCDYKIYTVACGLGDYKRVFSTVNFEQPANGRGFLVYFDWQLCSASGSGSSTLSQISRTSSHGSEDVNE